MKKRTRIKICGIRNLEDALFAGEIGADAIGFVFYPPSPRFITPDQAALIVNDLPPFLETVGIFVNEPADKVKDIVGHTGIDVIQLHGNEDAEYCWGLKKKVIKAFRVHQGFDCAVLRDYPVNAFLLDTYDPEAYGGTGKSFDWKIAHKAKQYGNIVLSGGLTPENVKQAIRQAEPYAVDVSSGVESEKGVKDHQKMIDFIQHIYK